MLGLFYMVLLTILSLILTLLKSYHIERIESQQSLLQFALKNSVNICLRAIINKASTVKLQSHTYKMMLITIMTQSLVVMSYYRAQMNAALNSQVDNIGINSWEDVLKSDYKLLFFYDTYPEGIFKYAYNESVFKKIYKEKMVNGNGMVFDEHYETGAISTLLSNDGYLMLDSEEPYWNFNEYPCQITKINALK